MTTWTQGPAAVSPRGYAGMSWDCIWHPSDSKGWVLEMKGADYWVAPANSQPEECEVGPFSTFEDAAACYETLEPWTKVPQD